VTTKSSTSSRSQQTPLPVEALKHVNIGIETTERELYVFGYCQRRLAFLVQQDTALFQKIEDVGYKDFTSKFVIFYKKVNSGRMFEFYEGDEGRDTFVFSDGLGEIEVGEDLERLHQPLLTISKARVRELANS
jgi:hypothetical protein